MSDEILEVLPGGLSEVEFGDLVQRDPGEPGTFSKHKMLWGHGGQHVKNGAMLGECGARIVAQVDYPVRFYLQGDFFMQLSNKAFAEALAPFI
jgi:hypothetical protein